MLKGMIDKGRRCTGETVSSEPPAHRKDRFASASGAQGNFDLIRLALLGTFPFSGEGIPAVMPQATSLPLRGEGGSLLFREKQRTG